MRCLNFCYLDFDKSLNLLWSTFRKRMEVNSIEFERNGEGENHGFGYYTNGYPINEKYIIKTLDEGINIKEE